MDNKYEPIETERAQTALHKLKIMKGQVAHIATCDQNGQPNLAPIGSMRITDDGKVHVISGFLHQTYRNLQANPKATFSFFQLPGAMGVVSFFGQKEEGILGYRVYCDFVEAIHNDSLLADETAHIVGKFPWFLRKPFRKFGEENFKAVLVFKINDIRETK